MKARAISLISGGLDSLLASRMVLDLGVEAIGLHFTSPLCNAVKDDDGKRALAVGREIGIRVLVRDKGAEYLDVVRRPKFGYGKNMNPCIDCRIHMLRLTRRVMEEEGASFVVTGEVVGQRPMSQRRETIMMIEKASGLDGLILRPLSALLLPLTLPEKEGVVDRDRLFDVNGRSRHRQYELVRDYGLKEFACPAGGCLLTDPMFSRKLKDFFEHEPENDLRDVGFLRVGRHFRFEKRRFIFGRNREENEYLERARTLSYSLFRPVGFKGPSGLVKGKMNDDDRKFVAAIFASYGKRSEPRIAFEVLDEERKEYAVEWASVEIDQYRIKESS